MTILQPSFKTPPVFNIIWLCIETSLLHITVLDYIGVQNHGYHGYLGTLISFLPTKTEPLAGQYMGNGSQSLDTDIISF